MSNPNDPNGPKRTPGPPPLRTPATVRFGDGKPTVRVQASAPARVSVSAAAPPPAPEEPEMPPEVEEEAAPQGKAQIRIGGTPVRDAMMGSRTDAVSPAEPTPPPRQEGPPAFLPKEAKTWQEMGIDPGFGEHMVLRYLLQNPSDTSRSMANVLAISWPLVKELLDGLKQSKIVVYKGTTQMGDVIAELTEAGRAKATETRRVTTYVGPAPVPWDQYLESVKAQSISLRKPGPDDLLRAFGDLSISEELYERVGPAVTSGRAMFLFGDPGNGKTSLAERMTRCFGDTIWIPYTLLIDGHLVKLFDPAVHKVEADQKPVAGERPDRRWVRITRPTVIAGGELTLEMLEIQHDPLTNVAEPSIPLKANCGTLVVDDFGRGRLPPKDLLNRWIFPLEKRVDFLKLPDGRKIATPFDCLLCFSTNLEPRDLADEAFMRRIPYKIRVHDPTEDEFRALVEQLAEKMNVRLPHGSVTYLIERHYKMGKRPFRFCHPRDLLLQVVHLCEYERRPGLANPPEWDRVVSNYFGAV